MAAPSENGDSTYADLVDYNEDEIDTEKNTNDTQTQPKGSYVTLQSSSFKDFMLKQELMRAIGDAGFEHPSEVQHETIPKALVGRDMIVQAKSGMGKTAVFVLATLQQIEPKEGVVDTLVLCHTREMAFQIYGEFDRFSKYLQDVKIGVVYGGIPYDESRRIIEEEKPHIVIGTPGRLLHLLENNVLVLTELQRFIIDECDNMLDQLDMRRQVQDVFKQSPHTKQVLMFSATISEESRRVCRKFTKSAEEIFVDDKKLTLHGLQQHFVRLSEQQKNRKLNDLLDALDFNQVVIFVRTKTRASQLNRVLQTCAFPSICVHADMQQKQRLQYFQEFKEYKHRILVSTNLFGRGVDIERVNIVINYDMPQDSDEYLHRVGRAGRFGTKGLAITFLSSDDEKSILDETQERFAVKISALPNEIDTATYMT